MKTFLLRPVFSGSGILLDEDKGFELRDGTVYFKRETSICVSETWSHGRSPDGRALVTGQSRDVKLRGRPFLVEIHTSGSYEDSANRWHVRKELSARAEQLAGLVSLLFPGAIQVLMGDMLLSKGDETDEGTWDWTDVGQFRLGDLLDSTTRFSELARQCQHSLEALDEERADACRMAVRWCFRGENERVLADQYVCYWVSLEVLSSAFAVGDSINARLLALLESAYAENGLLSARQCIKARNALYKARNKVLHCGTREIPGIESLINLARHTVRALLKKTLTAEAPASPGDSILRPLGLSE